MRRRLDSVENRRYFSFVMRQGHALGENVSDHQGMRSRQFPDLHNAVGDLSFLLPWANFDSDSFFLDGAGQSRFAGNFVQHRCLIHCRQVYQDNRTVAEHDDISAFLAISKGRRGDHAGMPGAVNGEPVSQEDGARAKRRHWP